LVSVHLGVHFFSICIHSGVISVSICSQSLFLSVSNSSRFMAIFLDFRPSSFGWHLFWRSTLSLFPISVESPLYSDITTRCNRKSNSSAKSDHF
jgi:hypothetical protein